MRQSQAHSIKHLPLRLLTSIGLKGKQHEEQPLAPAKQVMAKF